MLYSPSSRKGPENPWDFLSLIVLAALFLAFLHWLQPGNPPSAPPPRPQDAGIVEDWSGTLEPPPEIAPPPAPRVAKPLPPARKKPAAPETEPPEAPAIASPTPAPADSAASDSLPATAPREAEARPVDPLLTDPSRSFILKEGMSEWSKIDTLSEREKRLRVAERFKKDWKHVEDMEGMSSLRGQVRSRGLKDSHIPGIYLLDSNLIILPGLLLYQF